MAITGVMPLPALSSKIFLGKVFCSVDSGKQKSPAAWLIVTTSPAFRVACRCCDTSPSVCRFTVIAMRPDSVRADRLYTRSTRLPLISCCSRTN